MHQLSGQPQPETETCVCVCVSVSVFAGPYNFKALFEC